MKNDIGNLNPIRYRGYYWDSEMNLYYLQSRYYDPTTMRFINADGYFSTGQGMNGHNMFAYCENNPVMYSDPTGECYLLAIIVTMVLVGIVVDALADVLSNDSAPASPSKPKEKSYRTNELKVCTDGVGSAHNDAYHQDSTAYMGGKINADIHRYIVIPTNYPNYYDMLGCVGVVIDHSTGKYLYGVVGEGGPEDEYGEVSISMVWNLGYSSDGSYGPEGDFEFILFPGTKQNWDIDHLNEQVAAVGRKWYQ